MIWGVWSPRWIQTFTQPEVISSNVHPIFEASRGGTFDTKTRVKRFKMFKIMMSNSTQQKSNNNNNNNNNPIQSNPIQSNPVQSNPIQSKFVSPPLFFWNTMFQKTKKAPSVFFWGDLSLRHRHLSDSRLVLQGVPRESHVCRLGWPFGWGNHQRSRQRDHRLGARGETEGLGAHHLCWARGDFDGVCTHCSWMIWWMIWFFF